MTKLANDIEYVCLGVATWGIVKYHEDFDGKARRMPCAIECAVAVWRGVHMQRVHHACMRVPLQRPRLCSEASLLLHA